MSQISGEGHLNLDDPLEVAGHRIVKNRLRVVELALRPAVSRVGSDIEPVHELRVACRRAEAAIDEFSDCFPSRTHRRLRKSILRLRRAAGEARDWDVFLGAIRDWRQKDASSEVQAGWIFLEGYAMGQRVAAQGRLVSSVEMQGPKGFKRLCRFALEEVRAPKQSGGVRVVAHLMARNLDRRLVRFNDPPDPDADPATRVHQSRIAAKKLRFSIEVYGKSCPKSWRKELLPALVELQNCLGGIHDGHVAELRLKEIHRLVLEQDHTLLAQVEPGVLALQSCFKRQQEEWEGVRAECELRWQSLPIEKWRDELATEGRNED